MLKEYKNHFFWKPDGTVRSSEFWQSKAVIFLLRKESMYDQYLEFAKQLAYEAGGVMRRYFKNGVATSLKEDRTIVTIADKEINSLLPSGDHEGAELLPLKFATVVR